MFSNHCWLLFVHWLKKRAGIVVLLIMGSIGLAIYQDYGVSWDEVAQRSIGAATHDYIFYSNNYLFNFHDRDYGVAFELPLFMLENILNLKSFRNVILMRHLISHFFFITSAFCVFLLVDLLYKNKLLAVIGYLIIVLHPRLYAHSFFNTKDIPFLSIFLICYYINAIAFVRKKTYWFILLGFCTGILINLRIMGILLICCVLLMLSVDALMDRNKEKTDRFHTAKLALAFLASTIITLYATWPFLWPSPIEHFIFALKNMAKFRFGSPVLFKGELIQATALPWDYIPTWFVITTPIPYLAMGLYGIGVLLFQIFKNPFQYLSNTLIRNNLIFLICLFAPIMAVIILKSVLYDGWRQMYFIYPGFALLGIYGLHSLMNTKIKSLIIGCLLLSFCPIVYFMSNNHPFQHVYFNCLVDTSSSEYLRKQFELDYWGTSYKQSLDYILENDSSPIICITGPNHPFIYNISALPKEKAKRVKIVIGRGRADYYITNYRCHPDDYPFESKRWHSIMVNNSTINGIYKLK